MCLVTAPGPDDDPDGIARHILMMFNPAPTDKDFMLPTVAKPIPWRLLIDTAAQSPGDIYPEFNGPVLRPNGKLSLLSRSLKCFVSEN